VPPTSIQYTYDPDGRLSTVQDERHTSANTTYGYDALSRLSTVTQTLAGATGGQIVTSYGYDVQDNLTRVTDPNGNVTTYVYDDFHRLNSQSSPVSGSTTYTYDWAGNLLTQTDANGATTARTYDAANRLLSATSTRPGRPVETVTNTWGTSASPLYTWGRLATVAVAEDGIQTVSTATTYERRGPVRSETTAINVYR
jgi:YD repeat-containing protein